jgi:outer membrane lipoprotein-sorting protein
MRRLSAVLTVAAATLVSATTVSAQTADEVIEKHLAAIGGRAVLAKMTSQVAKGTVAVSTQGISLPGTVEIYRKSPNKARSLVRIDLSAAGGTEVVVDQRCDGKTAFVSNSMQGDREITGPQLEGMLNAHFPSPLLAYKEAGAKVELLGRETVFGREAFVLQFTPKTGPASKNYFDAETFLLVRNVTTLVVPEAGGPMDQSTDFADYRNVSGMKLPFRVTQNTTAQTMTITLTSIELNAAVDDTMFARPAAK